ncbi:hypothetical protein HPGCJGGD_2842 [Methylobacterium haplocladii]|nr:hypothetical protein HPGCJGGD_2842 [Methylobacterium haplocladii]
MLDHFDNDGISADLLVLVMRIAAGEIDGDDVVGCDLGRGQRLERALDPLGRRLVEVEVEVGAVVGALAAERLEARVERLPDGAELHVGGVAERQHAELDPVEPRCSVAH